MLTNRLPRFPDLNEQNELRILINNRFNKAINNNYHKQKKLNYTKTKHEQLTAIQLNKKVLQNNRTTDIKTEHYGKQINHVTMVIIYYLYCCK